MNTNPLAGRKVLLTGGTQGIGLQTLKLLLDKQCRVVVLARNTAAVADLQAQYPEHLTAIATDITQLDSVRQALSNIAVFDSVILNAGTCEYIEASQFDAASFARVINVNLQGNANILEVVIPKLLKSEKRPHIVGISSLVTELPLPRSEAYGASKAGFAYMLNSLRADLYRFGVDVTLIQPGFVKTPLTDRNDFAMPFLMEPEVAAQHVLKAIEQRKYNYRFPWQLALSLRLIARLPLPLQVKFLQKMVPKE
ncbi:SDR family NAD(P)-dependent oxidoreductase [Gilvimarinus agarilyticus]|uniref:SDR family NAD(P)-dependent oxidoreductase n=1 Tax=Gilvimarinus sp. 2_MG-2023 TaxID=3062666 RepID=UPI001C0836D0|nr:SDR family NAD(P)-dependent oxidoreductase [Gilvimarinus sp. 2_MG-2023]MBU2887137.1 SDR family NAD(P)-dependent oxidoreductase [Gilvimarinus agarilyticus]MDO6571796.1 SDR family NAD(P)-dependent oxidoreductase [Gilvimarinus sp. 2_MG-2023]